MIYENLYNNGKIFLMNDILEFLIKRKDVKKINQHLIDKNAVH
jgi:spore coat polysaccharide biosynthesis protein SpsF (cytidylyltransferase family)